MRAAKKILYFDHTAALGGGEIALLHLAEALDRKRFEPIVVLGSEGPLHAKLSEAGIETHVLPLAPGLALADVNLGPYIVALSKLDALAAPYHRLGKSIIEANRILLAAPDEAERRLRADCVHYLITCEGLSSTNAEGKEPADALQTLLFSGKPPYFLEPVPLEEPTPLKVWRLKS